LHNEGRLTVDSVADDDEIRIVCSMGFSISEVAK
jgi:hypothetical protein